jgi:hypothetical protein
MPLLDGIPRGLMVETHGFLDSLGRPLVPSSCYSRSEQHFMTRSFIFGSFGGEINIQNYP